MSTKSSALANEQMLLMRKTEHYLSIKQTSDQGVLSLIKAMQNKINTNLACDDLLEQLKHKPVNKLEIWETLKIRCISKCLTSIYATTLLTLFIKIELNIIGAYMFLSNSSEYTSGDIEWSSEFLQNQDNTLSSYVQQQFLENIENFLSRGLDKLMSIVEIHCEAIFSEIELRKSLDVEMITEKIRMIQEKIEMNLFLSCDSDGEDFFAKYMLPDLNLDDSSCGLMLWNDNIQIKSDEETLLGLNLETYDLLTSADFEECVKSLVNLFTNEYLDALTGQLVQKLVPTDLESKQSISLTMPFAKLIPVLNVTNSIFEQNGIKNRMLNDENLNVLSANVYEAFSVAKKPMMLFEAPQTSPLCPNSMLNQVI